MAKRVLSGMQPSGVLHLGNLLGALDNFVRLQAEHECFYFIADWHALSTNFEDTSKIRFYVREMLIDWLAAGHCGQGTNNNSVARKRYVHKGLRGNSTPASGLTAIRL